MSKHFLLHLILCAHDCTECKQPLSDICKLLVLSLIMETAGKKNCCVSQSLDGVFLHMRLNRKSLSLFSSFKTNTSALTQVIYLVYYQKQIKDLSCTITLSAEVFTFTTLKCWSFYKNGIMESCPLMNYTHRFSENKNMKNCKTY